MESASTAACAGPDDVATDLLAAAAADLALSSGCGCAPDPAPGGCSGPGTEQGSAGAGGRCGRDGGDQDGKAPAPPSADGPAAGTGKVKDPAKKRKRRFVGTPQTCPGPGLGPTTPHPTQPNPATSHVENGHDVRHTRHLLANARPRPQLPPAPAPANNR